MKQIIIIGTALLTINVFSQGVNIKINDVKIPDNLQKYEIERYRKTGDVNDTVINVSYISKPVSERNPVYYLNDRLVDGTTIRTINPKSIESINVIKKNSEMNNDKKYGEIHIKMKTGYAPKLLSLNDLKLKYTDVRDNPTIYLIDGEFINGDYDKCMVDENNILSISVEKFENKNEKIEINFVKLLTKTEENIRKSKVVMIRGIEGSVK